MKDILIFAVALFALVDAGRAADNTSRHRGRHPGGHTTLPPSKLSKQNGQITLPESIYMRIFDRKEFDKDQDGLKDDGENRLADTWRPYFIFDEEENALQSFEPVVLFRVYPAEDWNLNKWPRKIYIQYAFLWAKDGGYEGAAVETNDHWGDTASGGYELESRDGFNWILKSLSLWDSHGSLLVNNPDIEWSNPRNTYWGKMEDRPSPIIHFSSGKHHMYLSKESCESSGDDIERITEGEDCDEGSHRLANLTPNGAFTNVGEPDHHFIEELAPFGYADEYVWKAQTCNCKKGKQDCFKGGKGDSWPAGLKNECITPVYNLIKRNIQPGRKIGIDGTDMAILLLLR